MYLINQWQLTPVNMVRQPNRKALHFWKAAHQEKAHATERGSER